MADAGQKLVAVAIGHRFSQACTDAGSGDFKSGLSIDSIQMLDVANNTVAANSGSGTANVSGGVVSYLKIKVEGVERAIPLYGIVP